MDTEATQYTLFLPILSFIFYPIVYGRLAETVARMRKSSSIRLLKTHWLNYLCTQIILSIPLIVLGILYSKQYGIYETIIIALINCLAIYIWPLVFLEKRVLNSISEGLVILFRTLWKSVPLISLTILMTSIKIAVELSILYIFRTKSIPMLFGLGFFQNVINAYIGLMIFAAATVVIREKIEPITEPQVA